MAPNIGNEPSSHGHGTLERKRRAHFFCYHFRDNEIAIREKSVLTKLDAASCRVMAHIIRSSGSDGRAVRVAGRVGALRGVGSNPTSITNKDGQNHNRFSVINSR